MKLNELKNILSADRYILLADGKEHQYRRSELSEMYRQFGEYETVNIYSFKSLDNVIEIVLTK